MKIDRQAKIISIIKKNAVETQEDLSELLRAENINVTQATVSRDIRELKLIKTMDESGRYKYAPYESDGMQLDARIVNIFRQAVLTIDTAVNFVCVHTITGMANAAAVAIDSLKSVEILGCVAGDDTIFVMLRNEEVALKLAAQFKKMLKNA
jgi:transcriptional regulator of arginine metabolism